MRARQAFAGLGFVALVSEGVYIARKLWTRKSRNKSALLENGPQSSSTSISSAACGWEPFAPSMHAHAQPSCDTGVHATDEPDQERQATAADGEAVVAAAESSMSHGGSLLASDASSVSAGDYNCQEESPTEVPDDWEEWCVDKTENSSLSGRFMSSYFVGASTSAAVPLSVPVSCTSSPEPQCESPEARTDEGWLARHGCDAAVPTGCFLGQGATAKCHEVTVTLPSGRTMWAAKKVLSCSEDPEHRAQIAKALHQEVAGHRAAASSGRVVKLYGFVCDEEAGRFELLLELASGGNLYEELKAARKDSNLKTTRPVLSVRRTKKIATCMLKSLAAMHESGFAHMDIKPENILLSADGEPLLADFGLTARVNKEGFLEHDGGTLYYMAPEVRGCGAEQARQLTVKADMYSVGIVLSACIAWGTGHELLCIRLGKFRLPGFVPDDLRDLITQLTAWKPQDRPTPAEALLHPFFTAPKGSRGPRPRKLVQTW